MPGRRRSEEEGRSKEDIDGHSSGQVGHARADLDDHIAYRRQNFGPYRSAQRCDMVAKNWKPYRRAHVVVIWSPNNFDNHIAGCSKAIRS